MIDDLNRTFAIDGHLSFDEGRGGLPRVVIDNPVATAEVYLHGAHVTAFRPRGAAPVLWMSDLAVFRKDKAIRGGIPVAWPWFGPHPTNKNMPQHGFARTSDWMIIATSAHPDGRTEVVLRLTDSGQSRALWPHRFELELRAVVGNDLHLELRSRNTGCESVQVGGALHTYFRVGDIDQVSIEGFGGRDYLDQLDGHRNKRTDGPISIGEEVDRIYLQPSDECAIIDAVEKRRIRVSQSGSRTTVVWNPWIDKSARMFDFPDDGYRTMVCIEAANAADDVRLLRPGTEHILSQTISEGSLVV
jgi:glucose-6-phosphate 1-epimerase